MEIKRGNKPVSRKKFVAWTAVIFSGLAALKFFIHPSPPKKTSTVKMLTQDGKLVEVDVSRLSSKKKKIKDEDVHSWVQRKTHYKN
jgi:hypothetical protein